MPEDIRKKYPDIPWRNMAGMRDKVIHEYLGEIMKLGRLVFFSLKQRIKTLFSQLAALIR
ncbi:MAG: hypothetical protein OD815_001286 [Candidatus Alkanophagales archaeon MCA70_species_2]|nr:hypothetical protein [Candidatus Alkanophaga liquidiphilum]